MDKEVVYIPLKINILCPGFLPEMTISRDNHASERGKALGTKND
jgi:hypothetical protein